MNKTKKALAFLLALLVAVTALPFGMEVRAEQFGDYKYEENADGTGITITGYNGSGEEITIPSEIAGKQVPIL